jgi:predicted flap endonuclease-1-like 5' DNA nuclease
METTEQTHEDSVDPSALFGVALGFAGVLLIAKEKLLLGALSLVGGALIGLQSRQGHQQEEGAKTSPPKKAPTVKKHTAGSKPTLVKTAKGRQSASNSASAQATPKEAATAKPAARQGKAKNAKGTRATDARNTGSRDTGSKNTGSRDTAKGELHRIEGIGPRISEVLVAAGMKTFDQMAQATPEQLREILATAGNRFRLANPSTWPEQAALAAAGRWEELSTLKGRLKGGRRRG